MKPIYLLVFLCLMGAYAYSQEYGFKKREVRKLERFGIAVKSFDLENDEVANDFRTILELDRQQKSSRALGLAAILPTGLLIFPGILTIFAPFVGVAGISSIVSFLELARDSKNERDRLIYKYLTPHMQRTRLR